MESEKVKIALYGTNGHQIYPELEAIDRVQLVAVAGGVVDQLPEGSLASESIKRYDSLDEIVLDSDVELVSLCSPRRSDQANDAVRCMRAGKHVYAEKPCAMSEQELDEIILTSRETGMQFHEMTDTAFQQPYLEMRRLIADNTIGMIVQVLAQKSYPYADWRPQDETVDGGLLMQVGIHALRFIEHVAGVKVKAISGTETNLGNPRQGDLKMACSLSMGLDNGGLAVAIANYLNPAAFNNWGNETLRIFGTKGFVEATDGGERTHLVLNDQDCGSLNCSQPSINYFHLFIKSLLNKVPMPLSMEDELHPTRMVIRARQNII